MREKAMREDDKTIHFQNDLTQVLRNAELRRTADLGGWLKHYLKDRREARQQNRPEPVNAGRAIA
jgi:hypothetical protein